MALGPEERMQIDILVNAVNAEKAEQLVTRALKSVGSTAQLTQAQIQEMAKALDPGRFTQISKEASLAQINLRDFGSSMTIQAQRVKEFTDELLQGFFAFERLTQQITVLDESMRGNRKEVAATASEIAKAYDVTS